MLPDSVYLLVSGLALRRERIQTAQAEARSSAMSPAALLAAVSPRVALCSCWPRGRALAPTLFTFSPGSLHVVLPLYNSLTWDMGLLSHLCPCWGTLGFGTGPPHPRSCVALPSSPPVCGLVQVLPVGLWVGMRAPLCSHTCPFPAFPSLGFHLVPSWGDQAGWPGVTLAFSLALGFCSSVTQGSAC